MTCQKVKNNKKKTFQADLYAHMCLKRASVCALFMFLVLGTVNSQPLPDLLTIAVENNLQLKALEQEYFAALEKAPQVSQLPDPELGVGVFPSPVETRLGAQILRVSATQMLPWFGVLKRRASLENARAKAIYERIEIQQRDLQLAISNDYFLLYSLAQKQVLIKQNINLLESLERIALTKIESGAASAADVLLVQLKIEEKQQELTILETMKIEPLARINQILSRPLDTNIIPPDSLDFAILPYDKNELINTIDATHPTLRIFELQQETARQAIALNDMNSKPSFGIGADYIMVSQRDDAFPMNNGRDILQIRASVKIPLHKQQYEAKEREENFRIEALATRREETLSQFAAMLEQAYAKYETAQLRKVLYERQIDITNAAINILKSNYSSGGSRFDELLRLELERNNYDLKILETIVQSHLAKNIVDVLLDVHRTDNPDMTK